MGEMRWLATSCLVALRNQHLASPLAIQRFWRNIMLNETLSMDVSNGGKGPRSRRH